MSRDRGQTVLQILMQLHFVTGSKIQAAMQSHLFISGQGENSSLPTSAPDNYSSWRDCKIVSKRWEPFCLNCSWHLQKKVHILPFPMQSLLLNFLSSHILSHLCNLQKTSHGFFQGVFPISLPVSLTRLPFSPMRPRGPGNPVEPCGKIIRSEGRVG